MPLLLSVIIMVFWTVALSIEANQSTSPYAIPIYLGTLGGVLFLYLITFAIMQTLKTPKGKQPKCHTKVLVIFSLLILLFGGVAMMIWGPYKLAGTIMIAVVLFLILNTILWGKHLHNISLVFGSLLIAYLLAICILWINDFSIIL
jgi:asparagine N-glycosylation enzyme membrane subunit Stt3